jgi:hypothetical protein
MFTIFKRYPQKMIGYVLGYVLILILSSWSYLQGDSLFYLVPILSLPIYQLQCSFMIPLTWVSFSSQSFTLNGMELTPFKKIIKIIIRFEIMVSSSLLTLNFLTQEFVFLSIIGAIYAICSLLTWCLILMVKFISEAKKQGIEFKNVKFKSAYKELIHQLSSSF